MNLFEFIFSKQVVLLSSYNYVIILNIHNYPEQESNISLEVYTILEISKKKSIYCLLLSKSECDKQRLQIRFVSLSTHGYLTPGSNFRYKS